MAKRTQKVEQIDPHAVRVAYSAEIRAYCSVKQYSEQSQQYLCNFGYRDVWTPAAELSRFAR